jgi:hypothetical protein
VQPPNGTATELLSYARSELNGAAWPDLSTVWAARVLTAARLLFSDTNGTVGYQNCPNASVMLDLTVEPGA